MRTVVIGFLGTTLDRGGQNRWDPWRPSVDLCRHEDLVVARFELLSQVRSRGLANEVTADILSVSPETEVRTHDLQFRHPWTSSKSTCPPSIPPAPFPSNLT